MAYRRLRIGLPSQVGDLVPSPSTVVHRQSSRPRRQGRRSMRLHSGLAIFMLAVILLAGATHTGLGRATLRRQSRVRRSIGRVDLFILILTNINHNIILKLECKCHRRRLELVPDQWCQVKGYDLPRLNRALDLSRLPLQPVQAITAWSGPVQGQGQGQVQVPQ